MDKDQNNTIKQISNAFEDDAQAEKRRREIQWMKGYWTFWVKKFGEKKALEYLKDEWNDKYPDDKPLSNLETEYITGSIQSVNNSQELNIVQESKDRKPNVTDQQNRRSAAALKSVKRPMLEKKPSDQFISKSEPCQKSKKEIETERDAEDQKIVDNLLEERFSRLKKTKLQYR